MITMIRTKSKSKNLGKVFFEKKDLKQILYISLILLIALPIFSQAAFAETNLISNPGFESGSTIPLNWAFVTQDSNTPVLDTVSHTGSKSVKISISGTTNKISGYPKSDLIHVQSLKTYVVSAWGKTKGAGGSNTPAVRVVELDANKKILKQTNLPVFSKGTNAWTQKKIEFKTGSATEYIYIYANIWNGYGTFWLDDVTLYEKITATPTPTPSVNLTPATATPTPSPTPPLTPSPAPTPASAPAPDPTPNPSPAPAGSNLVNNPGFEDGTDIPLNWELVSTNGNTPILDNAAHNGIRSIKISISGTANAISGYPKSDLIEVQPRTVYTVSAWGKTSGSGGSNTPAARVVELDANKVFIRQNNLPVFGRGTNDWTEKKLEFKTGNNTRYLYIYANIWNGYGTFWLDDVNVNLKDLSSPAPAQNPAPSPTPTQTPDPSPTPSQIKPELGIFNRESVPSVDDTLMKWQIIPSTSGLTAYPGSDKVGYNLWSDWSKTKAKWTDQSFIQSRFNLAAQYKNEYEYAPFLLHEEMFGPIALSTWAEPKSAWQTVGNINFTTGTGIKVNAMLSKTYMDSTGKSEKEWEVYYTTILYKAWNEHVHALGKKSMVIGFLPAGKNTNLQADMEYQTPAWDYILKNYDAIADYSYPKSTAEVSYSSNKAKFINEKYTASDGKFIWIMTSSFGDWSWTWSEAVAKSEFNAVTPYADAIVAYPYTNMGSRTNPYPQYLLKFYQAKYG